MRRDMSATTVRRNGSWLAALAAVLTLFLATPTLQAQVPVSCSNA
jgi:hypothetical protein